MVKIKTTRWDIVEELKTPRDRAGYLDAVLELASEDGDAGLVAAALGDIAKARGMTHVARKLCLEPEGLYKALSPEGNPEFATVLKVIRALGLRLQAVPAQDERLARVVPDEPSKPA